MIKEQTILTKEIMTREVITVFQEDSLLNASEKMLKNEFNGLPVVDKKGKVVGIITEYDLLTKGTAIHLPTFIKLFRSTRKTDDYLVKGGLEEAFSFTVKDVMNSEPLTLGEDATLTELVHTFSEHHRINPIPIVNKSGILIGIVSRFDIIKFYANALQKMRDFNK